MTDEKIPLNIGTHRGPVVTEAQFNELLFIAEFSVKDQIAPEFVFGSFNRLLHLAIGFTLRPKAPIKKIKQLQGHLRRYRDLSRELAVTENFPPMLPPPWLTDAEDWFETMIAAASRGRKPFERVHFLMPKLLGFCSFAFNEEIVVTTRESMFHHDGKFARFAFGSIDLARTYIRGFAKDERYLNKGFAEVRWDLPTPAALRKQLEKGKAQRVGQLPDIEILKLLGVPDTSGLPMWKTYENQLQLEHKSYIFHKNNPIEV